MQYIFAASMFYPTQPAVQLILICWLFVVLILVMTYTSNLVAALATLKVTLPFTTLKEFAVQNQYQPTVYAPGSTRLVLEVNADNGR